MDWLMQASQSLWFRMVLVTIVLFSFGIYSLLNKQTAKIHVLTGRYDDKIPFWPAASLPYLLYFPYLFFMVTYGIIKTPYFAQIAGAALMVQLVAAFVFARHQTHVPRPKLEVNGFFPRLTDFIYRHDKPFCTFPSLHVAYSTLCASWSVVLFPTLAPVFIILSSSVIAATLFLKQHAIADVIGGLSVAAAGLIIFH